MGHTEGKIGVDYDHTHGKSPFTIATGNFKNGSNWQLIATANAKEDAEHIVTCWNEYDQLKAENEALKADVVRLKKLLDDFGDSQKYKTPLFEYKKNEY